MSLIADWQYESLLDSIMRTGAAKGDRTGTGTRSLFGQQLRYTLSNGFPLITTKKVFLKGVIAELLWLLSGDTNVRSLQAQGVHIWDEWADANGELGPVYGAQWRRWRAEDGREIDQISQALELLKTQPDSRRIIVSAWNVAELDKMALPPCHMQFQFYVANGKLSCALTQRSADMFLGVPFNIASYSLLTHMMAQQANLAVGDFIWNGGDCHIYRNHFKQVRQQVSRSVYQFPILKLRKAPSLFEYQPSDFEVINYKHHPALKGEVAV